MLTAEGLLFKCPSRGMAPVHCMALCRIEILPGASSEMVQSLHDTQYMFSKRDSTIYFELSSHIFSSILEPLFKKIDRRACRRNLCGCKPTSLT